MKIAVVGSGIAGLSCAHRLVQDGHDVALFEGNNYFGGHTHTVDVTLDGTTYGVDTGFLVFNHRTYPNLVRLFDELKVATIGTDMSFSVKTPVASRFTNRMLEWSGSNLDTVFSQRGNLFRPGFLRMLRDILRFNRQTTLLARNGQLDASPLSLGDFLDRHGYGAQFRDWYLLPMAGCIWSCPPRQMLEFPVSTFVRFCDNHGLLQASDRPQWRTVVGGARQYVDKLLAGIPRRHLNTPVASIARDPGGAVRIATRHGVEAFDHVVLASHSDQSLRLLQDASAAERELLGAVQYQPNRAVLHTDISCLPGHRKAWAAWNYQSNSAGDETRVCVHYLLNYLQPLPFKTPVIVSLNPIDEPHPSTVLDSFDYAHPVFDAAAVAAQRRLPEIQGRRNTWFAGAWTGYGFHEDGLKSGLAVAQAILRMPVESLPVAA